MRKSIVVSLLIIVLAVAAITGGTWAWFTANAEIGDNVFTAGTVEIEAGETFNTGDVRVGNWNPGDCIDKEVEVWVKGTKRVYLRMEANGKWDFTPVPDDHVVKWYNGSTEWSEQTDWVLVDGYYYYNGGYSTDGILQPEANPDSPEKVIKVITRVCLDGKDTDDQYQGHEYSLSFTFEAVQITA